MIEEVLPPEANCLSEPQQPALLADKSAIKLIDLPDELLDARIVEAHPLEQFDALCSELVVAALSRRWQHRALAQGGDPLVLEPVQVPTDLSHRVKGADEIQRQLCLP